MNKENNGLLKSDSTESPLEPEAIEVFSTFALKLKEIHVRLVMEGYTITEDGIFPPKDKISIASKNKRSMS